MYSPVGMNRREKVFFLLEAVLPLIASRAGTVDSILNWTCKEMAVLPSRKEAEIHIGALLPFLSLFLTSLAGSAGFVFIIFLPPDTP